MLNGSFSVTSHGKGPVDGIGGTIKRRVTERVLGQRESIHSTEHFAKLAGEVCENIFIKFVPASETINFIEMEELGNKWRDIRTEYSIYSGSNELKQFDFLQPRARKSLIQSDTIQKGNISFPKKTRTRRCKKINT